MIRFAGLMLSLYAATCLSGVASAADCTSPVAASDLIKPGTLVMSTNPTLPPLQYVDKSGALVGMRIELGTEIAKRLCLAPEFIKIEFDAMVPGLKGGRWDMIDTGIFFTPERAKLMQMIPYEMQAISISVQPDAKVAISKVEDLEGKTVGVEIGGFEETKAKAIDAELKKNGGHGMTIRTFDSFALAYQALRAGQVEAVVSIDGVAKEYADRGAFKRAVAGLYPTPVALALKSKPLADAVLKVLDAMQHDGSYKTLFDRYGVVPPSGALAVQGPAS
ncbi:ABC transporter substrate-binding protein [Lichenihabitans sp. Uapishka_5]|uniref:ABC transporter substrate-binding protein n=1 Tax=Lichenihabitans sp. Uapishka_5 TaxID=3037302 RepID=UPI0029E7FACF|nr:ABC transporter substrate-binding protein [Lichenihabitans sp. Uapishka_5]MDX7950817.1 ABC transporter substrate-binding protein [Lichenihabitans sp. Uapishka_5]